jgi:predicted ATPase
MITLDVVKLLGFPENIIEFDWPPWYPTVTENLTIPNSCLLAGRVGTGKTTILCNMAKIMFTHFADGVADIQTDHICRHFIKRVYFIHYREFTELIRQIFDDDNSGAALILHHIENVPILIIDDLLEGVVKDWDLTKLHALIDHRYCHNLRTWISTNFEAEAVKAGEPDLKSWPGFERTYSRLADPEWCQYYEIVGPDRRRVKE